MSVTAVCVLYLLHYYVVNRTDFLHLDFFAEVIYPPSSKVLHADFILCI